LAKSSKNPDRFHLPVAMARRQDCHFSFSGLKVGFYF
jgi:tRNA A37 threonylcarbamoyltransferase TsaD